MPTKDVDAATLARVTALLARAADAGATEEERRTSASIAARLIRQHGITIGAPAPPPVALPERARGAVAALREAYDDPKVRAALEHPRVKEAIERAANHAFEWLLGAAIPSAPSSKGPRPRPKAKRRR